MSESNELVELVPATFYDATAFVDGVERLVTSRDGELPKVVELHDLTIRHPGDASSVTWWVLDESEDTGSRTYYPVPRPAQVFIREERLT